MTMRRPMIVFALAFLAAGCGALNEPVQLLTDDVGCFAGGEQGTTDTLFADAASGTRFAGLPVVWPKGYTAHRAGPDVVVVDAHGSVKAVTGRTYHISHAWAMSLTMNDDSVYAAASDCGYAWDFVDCTAEPQNGYCKEP